MDTLTVMRLVNGGETPTVEFKQAVWLDKIEREPGDASIKPLDKKRKAEFAKDAMALANTFSYWGPDRYMLIGVDDDGNLVGLEKNATEQMMAQVLSDWCNPPVGFEYQIVEVDSEETIVVLRIPDSSLKPHHLVQTVEYKEVKGKHQKTHTCSRDTVWIRRGSHCHQSTPEESFRLRQEAQRLAEGERQETVPASNQWTRYLNRVIQRSQKFEAEPPISLVATDEQGQADPWIAISRFLVSDEDRTLFIVGASGIGKTTLISQCASELAQDAILTIESGNIFPSTTIPVFTSMNGYAAESGRDLTDEVAEVLVSGGLTDLKRWAEPSELLNIPEFDFVIFLDGLDEMRRQTWSESLTQVKRFLRSGAKVIVTSREGVVKNHWIESVCDKLITIQPVADDEIQRQFGLMLRHPESAWGLVSRDPELANLFRTPLTIKVAIDYFSGVEEDAFEDSTILPNRGRLLNHIFNRILDHDEKVDFGALTIAKTADRAEVLSELAFVMKERPATTARTAQQWLGEEYENLHNLGLIYRSGIRIKFFNSLAQKFFFAAKLWELDEEGETDVTNLPGIEPKYLQDCLEILSEITTLYQA